VNSQTRTYGQIILTNLFTFFNVLAVSLALLIIFVAAVHDPRALLNLVFLVIVAANTIIAILGEVRAKRTLDKLSLVAEEPLTVTRNGTELSIHAREVLMNDLVTLGPGAQIPADAEITKGECMVNESMLTGESAPHKRDIGDKLMSGTYVVSGNCTARATANHGDSYVEKMGTQARVYNKPRGELSRSLGRIIRVVTVFMVLLSIAMVARQSGTGIITPQERTIALTHTTGAVVGMVPAGLFLLVTMALAAAAIRLGRRLVLVRELSAIETLARATVVCFDKTGTLTTGQLRVTGEIPLSKSKHNTRDVIASMLAALGPGNQTADALAEFYGTDAKFKPKKIEHFSSETKQATVTFERLGKFTLGAADKLVNDARVAVEAKKGLRVLALVHAREPLALITIADTLRPGACETVKFFTDRKTEIRIISGDAHDTVEAVARSCGIQITRNTIASRATPEDKQKLIRKLRGAGHTVAMTGDGVNDILAFREADCAISIGSAAPAARAASHMVLLDNDWNEIRNIVEEGERVIGNVQNSAKLFLFKSVLSIMLALFAVMFLGGIYPFEPRNLYLLEILVIGLPSFFLALGPFTHGSRAGFIRPAIITAAVAVTMIAAIYILSHLAFLRMGAEDILTMAVLLTTALGLTLLVNTCMPLTTYRMAVLMCVLIAIIFAIGLMPDVLELYYLSAAQVIILITLGAAGIFLVRKFAGSPAYQ